MRFEKEIKEICDIMGFNYYNLLPGEINKINKILTDIYNQGVEDGKEEANAQE